MKDCIKKLLFKTEEVASIGTKYAPTVNEASFQSVKIFVHVYKEIEFNFLHKTTVKSFNQKAHDIIDLLIFSDDC